MKVKLIAKVGETVAEKLGPIAATAMKYSPEIFTGLGIVSMVGSNVLSGWATLKAKSVMEEDISYVSEDERRRVAIAKFAKVAGYYAPCVITTGLGISFVVRGERIQRARVANAVAAYSALNAAFNNYRAEVTKDLGPSADAKYYTGDVLAKTDIYEEASDGKKPKKHREEVVLREKMPGSPYAAIFDDISPDWVNNREQNLYFIKCQEVVANDKLRRRGYLFLSEVLDLLGLPYNPAGQFVGWIDEAYEGSVNGIVTFGIDYAYLEAELEQAQAEGRNPEPSIWLDFNVDGEIWDKIPLVKKMTR